MICVRFSRRSNDRGGQAPALRYARPSLFTVGRGPVPRHASIGTRNGLGLRAFFARVERSRGTGPRATVSEAASVYRRARACPSPCLDLKQDFQDFQDFTGLDLWCIGAVVACHGVFDASASIILSNRENLENPAPNHNNLENPAHILLIFFNLTKTRKNGIINTTFNSNFIFHINLKETKQ